MSKYSGEYTQYQLLVYLNDIISRNTYKGKPQFVSNLDN